MDEQVVLDLFAGVGGFSAAFAESPDWDVVTVELNKDLPANIHADVMDLRPADLPNADVVLASPPCTMFSTAGNHDKWDHAEKQPIAPESREHVALVHHTIGLIHALTPDYWFVENPTGRMRWVLGQPTATVTYCQYGRDNQKPTDLWGSHPPMSYRRCRAGEACHVANGADDGTSAIASMPEDYGERAKVPFELSESILRAVEGRSEQSTLTEASQ